MVAVPPDLLSLYRDGRLIPFIGAGVSKSVRWSDPDGRQLSGPSWTEFTDQAMKEIGFERPELLRVRGTDLQILEFYRHISGDRLNGLMNWLIRRMNPEDEDIKTSPILARLAALDKCSVLYTTNFDDFIERSLKVHGKPFTRIATESDAVAAITNPGDTQVIKFHGDWDTPDKLVITEEQFEHRLRLQDMLDLRLQADLLGRAVLFIGYSFRDVNVAYLFRLFNDQFEKLPSSTYGRRAYIAVADPSRFEIDLFKKRNVEVIPLSGLKVTEDVAELLETLVNA